MLELDEKFLLTHYLSEKILDELQEDALAGDALKMAEAKMKLSRKNKK